MICLREDDYTRDLEIDCGQALWRARLSDGSVVIQDDHRPGPGHHSAWVRLGQHLEQTGLTIRSFWLEFRGQVRKDVAPDDAAGYYFSKEAVGLFGGEATLHFYVMGYLQSNVLVVKRWRVPEMTPFEIETPVPATGPCLILNGVPHVGLGQ